jgi:hypothetical protein
MNRWRSGLQWFAAEFLVVVTGVLVALAVQATYERNADRSRETAYLRQLAAELRATEATMASADSFTASGDRAGVMLLRSYRAPAPRDSILIWLNAVGRFSFHLPVTGTAEALVASGDLRLIRDDSLRAAITAYVGNLRPILQTLEGATENWQRRFYDLGQAVDLNETAVLMPEHAGLRLRDTLYTPLPEHPERSGFAINVNELLRNRTAYSALDAMNSAKFVASLMRSQISEHTATLRSQVESELARR